MLNTRIFDELEDFRRTFDRWFANVDQASPRVRNEETEWVFSPAFETGWTDDYLHLRFVLPAVTDNDLEVTIQGNQLVVRGERKAPEGFGNENRTYAGELSDFDVVGTGAATGAQRIARLRIKTLGDMAGPFAGMVQFIIHCRAGPAYLLQHARSPRISCLGGIH